MKVSILLLAEPLFRRAGKAHAPHPHVIWRAFQAVDCYDDFDGWQQCPWTYDWTCNRSFDRCKLARGHGGPCVV